MQVEFDLMGRYVGSLPGQFVAKYLSLDLRLGWQPTESLELSVVGQNLLDGKHLEWCSAGICRLLAVVLLWLLGRICGWTHVRRATAEYRCLFSGPIFRLFRRIRG